jgi:hypothetical protein
VFAMVLRLYSCLFALILGMFMTGVSLVLLISGSKNFKFDMLPFWKGDAALYGLLALGLIGVATALLGFMRKVKPLLVIYSVVIVGMLLYGFFISPVYRFPGKAEATNIVWIAVAGLLAVIGSLMAFKEPRRA